MPPLFLGTPSWLNGERCHLRRLLTTSNRMQLSGCALDVPTQPLGSSSVIVKDKALTVFVGQNFDNVLQDMARGQGEHLSSLSLLTGIPKDRQKELFALAQELFLNLIQTKWTSPHYSRLTA